VEQCFHLWNQSELRWINPILPLLPPFLGSLTIFPTIFGCHQRKSYAKHHMSHVYGLYFPLTLLIINQTRQDSQPICGDLGSNLIKKKNQSRNIYKKKKKNRSPQWAFSEARYITWRWQAPKRFNYWPSCSYCWHSDCRMPLLLGFGPLWSLCARRHFGPASLVV